MRAIGLPVESAYSVSHTQCIIARITKIVMCNKEGGGDGWRDLDRVLNRVFPEVLQGSFLRMSYFK